ncbi:retrovirus-related pol polyprotein from transposon TNT 1-94 [Tanacetum coccineum]|uniref:Retrovirus-related pol polyprotein from transposon TNT 1-94 n=1 Tax=Tanacetum coccineum TaxID=301880 RepID=A0ABQ5C4U8_9ASTR
MSGTVPPILPPLGNMGNPNPNRVDTIPNDTINTTTITNVAQTVVDDNLPQLLDSREGSHVTNVPEFDKEDFTSWKVSSAANQKRFYKRSGRVGSARKPIDKSKEICFTYGKLGHFQKECPSNKISTPSYPSSNNSFNKPKPYTPSLTQTSSQNTGNHQKDYEGKYKGLKAEMTVLTKRIDDLTKGKSEKGKNEKGKSDKGLIAESFNWDEESVSSEDEGTTKIKAFMAIAEDEPFVGKANARSGQWVEITMKKALGGRGRRKEKISSKEVIFTKADESSSMSIPEITSESECETHEPLPPLPKLIGAEPADTLNSLISLADLTLNMADLTLNTSVPKRIKPTSNKVSPTQAIKKKTETKSSTVPALIF